jgi:hypothetical protein
MTKEINVDFMDYGGGGIFKKFPDSTKQIRLSALTIVVEGGKVDIATL